MIHILIFFLIRISLFFNLPELTALAFVLAIKKANTSGEFTVLCLGRSVFLDDVRAMAHFSGRLKYVIIHREHFEFLLDRFLGKEDCKRVTEANYYTADFGKIGKQKYYSYLGRMFPLMKKLIGFDMVLSGNFGYTDQQEFARVCEKRGIPVIVLLKEGMVIPGYDQIWANRCKTLKLIGTKILFYCEKTKVALLNAGVSGITEDKCKVVGMPRIDFYIAESMKKIMNKQITFFSFFSQYTLMYLIDDKNKIDQLRRKNDEFHKMVMEFARKHEDYKVVIKTKPALHYLQYVKDVFNVNFKEKIDNLTITHSGKAIDFIKNSDVIITFNSTTTIKTIAAGKVLVSPYFGDLIADRPWDFFKGYEELVNYAEKLSDLEDFVFNAGKYLNYSAEIKEEFLNQFVFIPDGQTSRRTESAIIKTIQC